MIATVTLNPTIDIVAPVKGLIKGSVLRTKAVYSYPGGKGTNVARALVTLGARALSCGFTGIRDSHETEHFLKHYGVEPGLVACSGSNRICLLITETSGNGSETVINSESDIVISKKDISDLMEKLSAAAKKCTHMIFSGSLPLSLPENFYEKAIRAVRRDTRVILDTSSRYLFHGVKAAPHILKQNIHELESAFDKKLGSPAVLKTFIKKLSARYSIPVIITTMNEKGSLLYDSGRFVFYPAVKVKEAVSPVGCGDAFSAGLAYALSKGLDAAAGCRYGAAAAAANLGRLGSCFFSKKDAAGFLKLVKEKKY